MIVKYRERRTVAPFKCIDDEKQVYLKRLWWHGNILYGYKDQFNTVAISKEDIICIKDKATGLIIFPS